MSFPSLRGAEEAEIHGVSRILDVLCQPIVIEHPHFPMRIALSPELGPKICYLLAVGDYEQPELELMTRYMEKGDTLLDVGGCAGITAALASIITGEKVVVVEPNPQLHALISEQVRLNNGVVNVVSGCVAAGDSLSSTEFYLHPEPWRSKLSPPAHELHDYGKIFCPLLPLNSLLKRWKPSVLMIDVEGAEKNLFKNALAWAPRLVIVEIHNFIIGDEASCEVIQDILDQGYRLVDRSAWNWVFMHGAGQNVANDKRVSELW